ncbi:MAG: threonine/serine exporter family protein [Peptococcaceae bacterium]|nr:threonine/serine exporter family protein [Peptococcaceae bacterium]
MNSAIGQVMEVCLLAGKIMLQSGAEIYRIEDTMNRIARACAISEPHSYVTPTGIFLTLQGPEQDQKQTRFLRIYNRQIDLNKIVGVNEISRKLSEGELTLQQAHEALLAIERSGFLYPLWLQILAAALTSGFFSLAFGGMAIDFLPSVVAGGLGFLLYIMSNRRIAVKFFSEILAAFTIGFIAYLFYYYGIHYLALDLHIDKIIIGSVMPLVPGVLIMNAIRDLMAGDLVAGLARGTEAFLTAFAIGTGVAVALAVLM